MRTLFAMPCFDVHFVCIVQREYNTIRYTRRWKKGMPSRVEHAVTLQPSGCEALVADCHSRLAVILTHPWGPLGGNLHNNVVAAAALYFQRLQITTVRFNFCGTQLGRGNAQVQQVQDVATQLLAGKLFHSSNASASSSSTRILPTHVLLVGYSYGSLIASSASANIPECVAVVAIAPPFAVQHWLLMFNADYHLKQAAKRQIPRLFLIGSRDDFTSEPRFKTVMEENFPNDTGAIIKDANHFFARREKDVMDVIGEWLLNSFPRCQGDLRSLRDIEFSTA